MNFSHYRGLVNIQHFRDFVCVFETVVGNSNQLLFQFLHCIFERADINNIHPVWKPAFPVEVELVTSQKSREPAKEITSRVAGECYKRGLVFLTAGIYSNVLRFLMPLVITEAELNQALDILEASFGEVCGG